MHCLWSIESVCDRHFELLVPNRVGDGRNGLGAHGLGVAGAGRLGVRQGDSKLGRGALIAPVETRAVHAHPELPGRCAPVHRSAPTENDKREKERKEEEVVERCRCTHKKRDITSRHDCTLPIGHMGWRE